MSQSPRPGVVKNVYVPDSRVFFVLESPHVDEVGRGYPLAGLAGRRMSRWLFERDAPFGLIAVHCRARNSLADFTPEKPYSVMNVTEEPLQAAAYVKNNLRPPATIGQRTGLKAALQRRKTLLTNHPLIHLQDQLYDEFSSECSTLDVGIDLVACGNIAQAFCNRVVASQLTQRFKLHPAPHPTARPGWDVATVARIKELLQ